MDSLVSCEWLVSQLGAPDLAVVDCTFHMPVDGRHAEAEYNHAHIPGARFLGIDAVADLANAAPHMLPSPRAFGAAMSALGIDRADRIIVYDNSPYRSAARGWFMFRHFGASRVAILDGGFQKWVAEGRPVESGRVRPRTGSFNAHPRSDVVTRQEVLPMRLPIADARGPARFEGKVPEPRPDVAPGHIPGSRNLPYSGLYNEDGTFKDKAALADAFACAGIDPVKPFIATCGSGVTANSLIFAARLLGNDQARLYDGSWSEWGADPATPKAIG